MNKKMFATSMALVLAMTMVLAVGKTRQAENVEELAAAAQANETEQGMQAQSPVVIPIAAAETESLVKPSKAVVIPVEIDQNEVILSTGQEAIPVLPNQQQHPLVQSMAKVEEALQRLESVATKAHMTVAALEQQYPLR